MYAQKHHFSNFSIDKGLAKSQVYSIFQDSRGYMWFGTAGGVSRYDGKTFRNYDSESGLASNVVYAITEDKQGHLWFGTDQGLSRFLPIATNKSLRENFVTLSVHEGFFLDNIFALKIDDENFLWVCNNRGITRINLNAIKTKEILSNSESFLNQSQYVFFHDNLGLASVNSCFEDSENNLWFGSYYLGLFLLKNKDRKLDLHRDIFHNLNVKGGLLDNKILAIEEDNEKNLWLGTSKGVCIFNIMNYNSDSITLKQIDEKNGLINNNVRVIYKDQVGSLWIGTSSGVSKIKQLSSEAQDYSIQNFNTAVGLCGNSIWAIAQDSETNMWFGSFGNGTCQLGTNPFKSIRKEEGLENPFVLSILTTPKREIYVGTDGSGLYKYQNMDELTEQYSDIENYKITGENKDIIYSLEKDSSGKVFCGIYNSGLYVVETHLNKIGLDKTKILSSMFYNNQQLWIATNGAGIYIINFDKHATMQEEHIFSNFSDLDKNNLFISPDGEQLTKSDSAKVLEKIAIIQDSTLIHNTIYTLYRDHLGFVWIGTYRGISICHPQVSKGLMDMKFTHLTATNGFYNPKIHSITEDNFGNFWIGTNGSGVVILTKRDADVIRERMAKTLSQKKQLKESDLAVENSLYHIQLALKFISTKDGLSDNSILSILPDNNNNILIGTNKGLNKINSLEYLLFGKKQIRVFGKEEGLYGVECNLNALTKDVYGKIYIGTIDGLYIYDPSMDRINSLEPKTLLTDIKVFHKSIVHDTILPNRNPANGLPLDLVLPYNQNQIEFDFISICMTLPEKVLYKYKLEGFDETWSPEVETPKANYTNLFPGNYCFQITAMNNDGIWNSEPIEFNFSISPPFWQTNFFYISELLFFVGLFSFSLLLKKSGRNTKIATLAIFICVFLLFEFIRTLIEPYFDDIVGGIPLFKVFLNLILAYILFPIERILKKYMEGN